MHGLGARNQALADCGPHVVDLEFGGDDGPVQGRAAGIGQRIVGRVADHAAMHKTVLLEDVLRDRHLQLAATEGQGMQLGAYQHTERLQGQKRLPFLKEQGFIHALPASYRTSKMPAAPMPPPIHMVTQTRLAPRRLPSISAWPVRRWPLTP